MAEQVAAEPSIADLRALLVDPPKAEATPEAKPDEKPAEAKTEPATEPEKTQEQPRDDKGQFAAKDELPAGVQKRIQKEIDRATAARKEAERLRDEMAAMAAKRDTAPEKKPEAAKQPKPEDFPDDFDAYLEARIQWAAAESVKVAREQERRESAARESEQQNREIQQAWNQRLEEIREKRPDFDEVIDSADIQISTNLVSALKQHDTGAELLYHLAQHPKEVAKLNGLSAFKMAVELGRISARIETPAKPQPKADPLPKPAPVVGGAAAPAETDLEKCDMRTFKREFQKRMAS